MKKPDYTEQWPALKSLPADRTQLKQLARRVAHAFMDAYLEDGKYQEEY